jgi:type IV pilus assembly protein PilQ
MHRLSTKKLYQVTVLFIMLAFILGAPSADSQYVPQSGQPDAGDSLRSELLKRHVSIDADDAFLPSILTVLAEKSGFNIVTGPEVNTKQRISVHLKETPIEEAINLVVRAAGLSYEKVGKSFLVAAPEALEKEIGLSAHVINLQYANAKEVKELLVDITENVQVDVSGNRLLVLASPKVYADVKDIVAQIDKASQQILLEARLVEVATSDLAELGIDWERLSPFETIVAENATNEDGTGRPPGHIWPYIDRLGARQELGPDDPGTVFEKFDDEDRFFHFSRRLLSFDVALDWLVKNDRAKVLANTKITTLNNREAAILIGEVIPFSPPNTVVAGGLALGQQIVERDSIGVKLRITPVINTDGYVTVSVEPEVSSIIELVQDYLPRKKIRTANTTVMVRDGEKIFIGGLLSIDKSSVIHKFPILGDIPLLGYLFQHRTSTARKTDLLIEITPKIVSHELREEVPMTVGDIMIYDEGQMTDLEAVEPKISSEKDPDYQYKKLLEMEDKYAKPKGKK